MMTKKKIYNFILKSINEKSKSNKYIYIDGPGGCGKSYLLNSMIKIFSHFQLNVLPVAWTGIAANLLENGMTASSAFKLPLKLNENSVCNINANSTYAEFLKNIDVIIWDEISMTSKLAFETVNNLFQDTCKSDELFGGKIVILSGDL